MNILEQLVGFLKGPWLWIALALSVATLVVLHLYRPQTPLSTELVVGVVAVFGIPAAIIQAFSSLKTMRSKRQESGNSPPSSNGQDKK